jgi:polar amino acid transport system permease protein
MAAESNYAFLKFWGLDFNVLSSYAPDLWSGFLTTLECWVLGVALGALIGFFVAILFVYAPRILRIICRVYVEIIRGTPFLVQLFLIHYGTPVFGLYPEAMDSGVIGLAIYGSAYFAEIFRAGFLSVPKGQLEAAEMFGFSRWQMVYRLQAPQMLVMILPAMINLIIILSKETAVLSIVTVPELTSVFRQIGTETFAYIETLMALCLVYIVLTEATAKLGRWLERKVGAYMGAISA